MRLRVSPTRRLGRRCAVITFLHVCSDGRPIIRKDKVILSVEDGYGGLLLQRSRRNMKLHAGRRDGQARPGPSSQGAQSRKSRCHAWGHCFESKRIGGPAPQADGLENSLTVHRKHSGGTRHLDFIAGGQIHSSYRHVHLLMRLTNNRPVLASEPDYQRLEQFHSHSDFKRRTTKRQMHRLPRRKELDTASIPGSRQQPPRPSCLG